MNHTPARILAQSLTDAGIASGVGGSSAWACFINFMPDGTGVPDNAITVYDTPGAPDGRLMGTGAVMEHPGVQVRVRGTDHSTAYAKAQAIATHLSEVLREGVVVGSSSYTIQAVSRRGNILPLGPENDKHRRHQFTINVTTTLVAVTTTTTTTA